MDSCGFIYAADTVYVSLDSSCIILKSSFKDFKGSLNTGKVNLNWDVANNRTARYFELERSFDLREFVSIGRIAAVPNQDDASYAQVDNIVGINSHNVHYRIAMVDVNGSIEYSKIVALTLSEVKHPKMRITPNPANKMVQLSINSPANASTHIMIYDMMGKMVRRISVNLQNGVNVFTIDDLDSFSKGIYLVKVSLPGAILSQKLLIKE